MSAKRLNPLANPPNPSSNDEEDEEESEEIVESSSSEEEEEEEVEEEDDVSSGNPIVKKPETEKKPVSDSESGSDEETDSEPETERKDPVKNPEPSVVTNRNSVKATKKRSSETDVSMDAKRAKTVSGEETKKNYFQRVWSEEDEIALLQGIIDYNIKTGSSPYDDTNVFYELVKKSISFDVSKTQFMEKLRSLKKKFENSLSKVQKKKKIGEDQAFSKPHDRKAFDLSKLVWGDNGIMALESSAVKSNVKSNRRKKHEELVPSSLKVESVVKKQEFVSIVESLSRFGVDDLAAKQGWDSDTNLPRMHLEDEFEDWIILAPRLLAPGPSVWIEGSHKGCGLALDVPGLCFCLM